MNVVALQPVEGLVGLPDLRALDGAPDAEAQLLNLARHLDEIDCARRVAGWSDVAERANALAVIASRLGLGRLAAVAHTVAHLAAWPDDAALAANLARLSRMAEATLTSCWSREGMQGTDATN